MIMQSSRRKFFKKPAVAKRFTDPEANKYLQREYRPGFVVPQLA